MKDEELWLKDCESICWECASTFMLKRRYEGVTLCLWCRIKEYWQTINWWRVVPFAYLGFVVVLIIWVWFG